MKLTITFCTQYNGVYISPSDLATEVTDEMDGVFDRVADTLPSMTYDMCDYCAQHAEWDYDLTEKQIAKLIKTAQQIIAPVIPVAEISFEYDHTSS